MHCFSCIQVFNVICRSSVLLTELNVILFGVFFSELWCVHVGVYECVCVCVCVCVRVCVCVCVLQKLWGPQYHRSKHVTTSSLSRIPPPLLFIKDTPTSVVYQGYPHLCCLSRIPPPLLFIKDTPHLFCLSRIPSPLLSLWSKPIAQLPCSHSPYM